MSITENLKIVRERIADAAVRAGKDSENITLIAVTKTVDASVIKEAISAGVTDIGENYVQDALHKFTDIGHDVKWHMIGHLQTNKVKQVIPVFDLIQSVDSTSLANEIGKRSIAAGRTTRVLVEINISGEESKNGVEPDKALELCGQIAGIHGLELSGMMGIAPFTDDVSAIRKSFALLRRLWEKLPEENSRWLSMGMTSDFEIAIEEGSNMVRIGTAIFGARPARNR